MKKISVILFCLLLAGCNNNQKSVIEKSEDASKNVVSETISSEEHKSEVESVVLSTETTEEGSSVEEVSEVSSSVEESSSNETATDEQTSTSDGGSTSTGWLPWV